MGQFEHDTVLKAQYCPWALEGAVQTFLTGRGGSRKQEVAPLGTALCGESSVMFSWADLVFFLPY